MPATASFGAMNLWDGGGYEPPDTTVGASSGYVIEAVNSLATVYDKSGNVATYLNTAACTTNGSTDTVSDPRVLFDKANGQWLISTTTFSPIGDASWNLSISSGSDPVTASWYCLIIPTSGIQNPDGSVGNFPDFPKMGISADKVVLTGDAFSPVGHGPFTQNYRFQGTEFVVLNKADLLALSTVRGTLFEPDQGDFAIEPAQELGTAPSELYMAAVDSSVSSTSKIDVWRITGVPGENNLQVPPPTSLPIATMYYPPNAQQAGTGTLIDVNDDSLLDAVYRNGSLWVSANDGCTPTGDSAVRSCLRFINIDLTAGPMAVVQDFDYADKGTYYYYPAIRTDSSGNLFAAFSGSSSTEYASAYAGLQLFGDDNQLDYLSVTKGGDAPYTLSPARWGDYSGAAVDPGGSIWLGAEYATSNPVLGSYWGTEITNATP